MADSELTRRHFVFTINATTTTAVTNDGNGIKMNHLWKGGVSIKRKIVFML